MCSNFTLLAVVAEATRSVKIHPTFLKPILAAASSTISSLGSGRILKVSLLLSCSSSFFVCFLL